MKRIICLMTLLSLAFGCTLLAQSEPQIETTCTTARLSFETSLSSEAVSITVFKDTLIFEENFENFLSDQVNSSSPIGGAACLVEIPHSLTQYPGCRAQNMTIKNEDECHLSIGKFSTPKMNIPQSSKVFIQMKAGTKNILKINNDTINHSTNSQLLSRTISDTCNEMVFSNNNSSSVYIDYIKIISPREYLLSENWNIVDGNLLINNLLPNTGYYVEITDNQNQVSEKYFLKTKKRNQEIISRIQDPNSVKLEWENCGDCSPTSLSLYKVENETKDLFFSRIASAPSNFGLEIFNGTGKDICLGDYEVVFYHAGNINAQNNFKIRYSFMSEDTIREGDYCNVLYKLEFLSQYDYVTYPIKYSDAFMGGNDAFLLLKKDAEGNYKDTIDLFGSLGAGGGTVIPYNNTILTRKPTIRQGIKKNLPNSQTELYSNEWNAVEFSATNLNDTSLRHSLATPITYTYVGNYSLETQNNELVLSGLESQTKYLCILKRGTDTLFTHTFSIGNIVETQSSGSWSESSVWSGGVEPEPYDKVVVNKGHKITIAEGESVSCSDLVLCSDYSALPMDNGKSELSIEGTFSVNNVEVQASFDKYTENVNGWHLFGVPIDVNSSTRESIAESFNRGYEDDLYYLDEARYAWIPYLQNVEDANFFTNKHGYLVAYKDDKTLSFKGDLFLEDSIVLLNNASYTLGNGYHLVCNPYPFSVGLNNFTSNKVSGMWLLNPQTGAYVPNDNNQPSDFRIPPFGGVMTKVDSVTNSLVLRKKAVAPDQNTNAKSVIENLKFRLLSDGGYDEMKIYFRNDSDSLYDKYDTYKMFSIGSAPDLYCSINDLSLSIASLSELDDSLRLRINILSKDVGDLKLQLYEYTGDFERVDLLDADSESLVCSLLDDSLYSISYNPANEIRTFDLLVKKRVLLSVNKEDNEIEYIQIGRNIEIKNPQQIEEVVLFDIQGREILRTETEFLTLPFEGSFVLVIKSNGKEYFTKIISI